MASRYPVMLPPIGVTQETAEALRATAGQLDRSMSWIVRKAVEQYVASQLADQHPGGY
jgi:predicted transcriptional regulator